MLSIDRKDNKLGYQLKNISLACLRCNNIKSDFFSEEEWTYVASKFIKPRIMEYHKFDS